MTASDIIAALALIVSVVLGSISIVIARRADRRSQASDIPVANVFVEKCRFAGWALLRVEIDNRTTGTWTVETVKFTHDANAAFAGVMSFTLPPTDWHPSQDHTVGIFRIGVDVRSGAAQDFHIYARFTKNAVSGSSSTGAPLSAHPITRLFSRRAMRISLTKHAWSVERQDINVPIKIVI